MYMAVKDHSLDGLIIEAARAEFLALGYQKASLHKIAERAGLTTGALYTRYQSKDDLFCSLVRPLLSEIGLHFEPINALYLQVRQQPSAEALLNAIRQEEAVYLELLFSHYEDCVLLFCRSGGSSLENRMTGLMQEKTLQTRQFFQSIARKEMDFDGIDLIMSEQFYYYKQILLRGYSREKAVSCMKTIDLFLEAGWKALLEQIL